MKNTDKKSETASLRQKAEESLKNGLVKSGWPLSEAETRSLVHELQVHQIELEMQNEELTLAKEKAEVAAEKFAELFDFAPT
ncbi:MAG: hybrid sensor histidine kinase/response regulator, partial [Bacteroidota bacterium]